VVQLVRQRLCAFWSSLFQVPTHELTPILCTTHRNEKCIVTVECQTLNVVFMKLDTEQHNLWIEVPYDKSCKIIFWMSLLPCCHNSTALTACNRCDPPLVPFQVGVVFLTNTLYGEYCSLCPEEVHVWGVDHHAVLLREIKTYASCYVEESLIFHLIN
jgi:hypothetical protein